MVAKTWDELYEQAEQERAAAKGKLLKVTFAMIGDGNDIYDRHFSKDDPLVVRLTETDLEVINDASVHVNHGLMDTFWDAKALPGQLAKGEHVSWVDGPTYYLSGKRKTPSWVGEPTEGDFYSEGQI